MRRYAPLVTIHNGHWMAVLAAGFIQGYLCLDQDLLAVLRLEAHTTVATLEICTPHRQETGH